MKKAFDTKLRLSAANKERLNTINGILEEYRAEGYVLTLRQLYYQLVARDIIPNQQKQYTQLSNILKKGRMAGIVDWSVIEDRMRKPRLPYYVSGIQEAIYDTIHQYRLNRMAGQFQRIEVWVEKDALSNVLSRVTDHYHVRLMVNRGYSSLSAMYEAYLRLSNGDTILYLGDHDPSGLDMVRDIEDRLWQFGLDINVVPIALTMDQIKKFNPPPNPARVSDPRAEWYIEKFGNTSWELDALPPEELISLVEKNIEERIDKDLWEEQVAQERRDIEEMKTKFNIE